MGGPAVHTVATILEFLMSLTVGGLILAWIIAAARQGRAKAWVGAMGRSFLPVSWHVACHERVDRLSARLR
jgi:hypothetical protein